MNIRRTAVIALLAIVPSVSAFAADEPGQKHSPFDDLAWQPGPLSFTLGSRAKIELPEKTAALSESESNKFLKLTGNLPTSGLNIVTNGA